MGRSTAGKSMGHLEHHNGANINVSSLSLRTSKVMIGMRMSSST